ncbi:MAG TPA: MFS transporter [Candidatus Obscuribacterales bacterium]
MMNTESQPKDVLSKDEKKKGRAPLLLIFLTVFIDLVGFGLIIPVLPTYAQQLHADGTQVGLLLASYSLMQFLFTPFWGRLSDRIGRRPVLLVSLLASSVGYAIWGLSTSLEALFLSRIVAGAGNANIAVAQAYVSDVTSAENRAKGMGMVGAAFGLGFVLGPAIGGFSAAYGLQTIGFIACAISVVDLVLTFFLLPEPEKRSHAGAERFAVGKGFYLETLASEKLRTSLAIFFISTFAFANMEATLVMLTRDQFSFTPQQNSLMFTYIGVLIVLVQGGMIHRLAKKYGEKRLISIGTVLVSLGLLLTPFTKSVPVLCAALALLAVGSGINNPSNQSMISKLAPPDRVGGVLGVGQSLSTLGRILGPSVGGASFQYLGMSSPYVIGAVAMVVAFLISLRLPDVHAK